VKKMDKVDGPDSDKSDWIKLEFLMDPKDGCPEEWIKCLIGDDLP
jgi:hypothetical protein